MQALSVILDGEGAFPELVEKEAQGKLIKDETGEMLICVAGLVHGTSGGNAAVLFRIDLPDGTTVLTQTTLRLFQMAAQALTAKYGWQ